MSDRRDDMFRVKPRPPKGAGGSVERRFLSRVKMEISKLGGAAGRNAGSSRGRGGRRGRGQVTAQLMDANRGPRARRVVDQDPARHVQASRASVGRHASALHRP